MLNCKSCRGARHRLLISIYIAGLTLSMTPAMVAPPPKSFAQGQPEMQQSMDNMATHKHFITIRGDGKDYQAELTSKTSNLLAEAEQVLQQIPNTKEKQWIEAFVQKMRGIENAIHASAQRRNLPNNISPVSGATVLEGLPTQPTQPATSAVPGNPFQRSSVIGSKFAVTSPELSTVLPANEYSTARQAVTESAVLTNVEKTEGDELVRELESLHQVNTQQVSTQNSKVLNHIPNFTTPSTAVSSESGKSYSVKRITPEEPRVSVLESKLIKEIAEFQKLGGVLPKEVLNSLNTNNHKEPAPHYNQDVNFDKIMKFTEAGMGDRRVMQRLNDINNEDEEISKTNFQNIQHHGQQLQYLPLNRTVPNNHPNLLQAFPIQNRYYFQHFPLQNREYIYRGGLQGAAQDIQKANLYNHGRYPAIITPNQQVGHIPQGLRQILPRPYNFYNGHLPASDYNNYYMRQQFDPYRFWAPENSTLHIPPMMSPYIPDQPMHHKIDTQLTDEMKRELRDGKIVVLSNSAIRTNFEPNNNGTTPETSTEKGTAGKMEKKENETTTRN